MKITDKPDEFAPTGWFADSPTTASPKHGTMSVATKASLVCPSCGEENLHLCAVQPVEADKGSGIAMKFWCEHCPHAEFTMDMINYKGTVFYGWR